MLTNNLKELINEIKEEKKFAEVNNGMSRRRMQRKSTSVMLGSPMVNLLVNVDMGGKNVKSK
jgi:hypothetical protein